MTTRSFLNVVVFETVLDSIPDTVLQVNDLAQNVFSPYVKVVESNCNTLLGTTTTLTFESEGLTELSRDVVLSRDRIVELLSKGVYKVQTRDLSTCIAEHGICQACYKASRPTSPVPPIGSLVQILPEVSTYVENISVIRGSTSFTLSQEPDLYDNLYVYNNGVLLPGRVSGALYILPTPIPADSVLTVRYTTYVRAAFFFWLAKTYSGSLLGVSPIDAPPLPLRRGLIEELLSENQLREVQSMVGSLSGVPEETYQYLDKIEDNLEKALLLLTLYGIYLNVS